MAKLVFSYGDGAGCNSKLPPCMLQGVLLGAGICTPVGEHLMDRDDAAAVHQPDGSWLIFTADNSPLTGDTEYNCGRIAALNAMSDVWAMGGIPRYLAGTLMATKELTREQLTDVVRGANAAAQECGAVYVTGQMNLQKTSVTPWLGFSVVGTVPSGREPTLKRNLRVGDILLLTKPIGTGIILAASQLGLIENGLDEAVKVMCASNRVACEIFCKHGVLAATDISGNGLGGSLAEMTAMSGVAMSISPKSVALIPGTESALEKLPGYGSLQLDNWEWAKKICEWVNLSDQRATAILFDPQTSGGLLGGVRAGRATAVIGELREAGLNASAVGRVTHAGAPQITLDDDGRDMLHV